MYWLFSWCIPFIRRACELVLILLRYLHLISETRINGTIDKVLKKFQRESIEPLLFHLETKAIKIRNGRMYGFTSIHRCGDCTLNVQDNNINCNLQLEITNVLVSFDYKFSKGLSIKGKLLL